MAMCWRQAGQSQAVVAQLEEALRLQPNYPDGEYNLGNALAGISRMDDAILHYQAAVRLDPGYVGAHTNLGVALARTGRVGEAIGEFETALRLRPDSPEEMNNLGNALAQAGRREEARAQYENAVRLRPDYAQARQNLVRLGYPPDSPPVPPTTTAAMAPRAGRFRFDPFPTRPGHSFPSHSFRRGRQSGQDVHDLEIACTVARVQGSESSLSASVSQHG